MDKNHCEILPSLGTLRPGLAFPVSPNALALRLTFYEFFLCVNDSTWPLSSRIPPD